MTTTGLTIKTYMGEHSSQKRLDIIKTCLDSLKENVRKHIDHINIVVDGSKNPAHLDLIKQYENDFTIIKLEDNVGIAGATNTGIKALLDKGVDTGFCCDDDIYFKKNFAQTYLRAIRGTGIHHFCYYPHKELISKKILKKFHHEIINRNGFKLVMYGYSKAARSCPVCKGHSCPSCKTPKYFAGACYTFTKEMIETIGYLPVLPYKYGVEHEIFSARYYRRFQHPKVDLYGSHKLLTVISSSFDVKSDNYDDNKVLDNATSAESYLDLDYIPFAVQG